MPWSLQQALFGPETKRAPAPGGAAPSVGVSRIGPQGRLPYPSIDPKTLVRAFKTSEIAFACCDIRATAASDAALDVLERGRDGTYHALPGHPLRRLLIRPNSGMTEAAFMRAMIISMDVCGVAYCERLLSPSGGLVGLNPLNPASVTPVILGAGMVYRWQELGHAPIDFQPDELLIRRGDWTRPSRMAVALGTIDADSAQTDYVRSFFNNGGVPSGRIKVKGTLSKETADGIRNRWRDMFGRGGRQHDVAVFDDNGDYEKIGANLDELESAIVRGVSESRICMAFGVPPLIIYSYFGLERATYSNMREALSGFWDLTMSPLLKDWRTFFAWSLLSEFESEERILNEDIKLGWDMSLVSALQDDLDVTQARALASYAAGVTTLNEARSALGLDPDPQGDAYATAPLPATMPVLTTSRG